MLVRDVFWLCVWHTRRTHSPLGQGYSWGVRQALTGHEEATDPRTGVFAASHEQHTAILQPKYYGSLGVKVDGHTIAEVLDQWMTEDPAYYEHIDLPAEVPIPLWVTEVVSFTADGIAATTAGTGCDGDAVLFGLCPLGGPCTGADDLLAGAGVGDTGATTSGGGPVDHTPLQLRAAANPACAAGTLTLPVGAYLALSYKNALSDAVKTRKIALPAVTLGGEVPLPLTVSRVIVAQQVATARAPR